MEEKLKQFIKDNNLEFTEGRRNFDSVVLSGYALYLDANSEQLKNAIEIVLGEEIWDDNLEDELDRVFDYAKSNNYGKWWEKEEAKKMYKF